MTTDTIPSPQTEPAAPSVFPPATDPAAAPVPADTPAATTEPTQNTADAVKPSLLTGAEEDAAPETEGDTQKTQDDTPKADEPTTYEFKKPETLTDDSEIFTEVKAFAEKHKLSQDAAQALLDERAAYEKRQGDEFLSQMQALYTQWEAGAKADKEIGGTEFNKKLGVASQALKKFGNEELRKVLDETKMGSHPEIIRVFYRVGKAMSEGNLLTGGKKDSPTKTAEKVLFPNHN